MLPKWWFTRGHSSQFVMNTIWCCWSCLCGVVSWVNDAEVWFLLCAFVWVSKLLCNLSLCWRMQLLVGGVVALVDVVHASVCLRRACLLSGCDLHGIACCVWVVSCSTLSFVQLHPPSASQRVEVVMRKTRIYQMILKNTWLFPIAYCDATELSLLNITSVVLSSMFTIVAKDHEKKLI